MTREELEKRITRDKAIADLECMAIEIIGRLATEESKVLERYLEAINTAQEALKQPTADEIIRKCAEVMVNRMIWGSGVEWEINRLEKYLREKVLNDD